MVLSADNTPLLIGQLVQLSEDRTATVRFVGYTSFSTGAWVGVTFEDRIGKNDGSVQGQRYFDCLPEHGMFVRPHKVLRVLNDETPRPPPATALRDGDIKEPDAETNFDYDDPFTVRRQTLNAQSPTPGARRSNGDDGQSRSASQSSTSTHSSNTSGYKPQAQPLAQPPSRITHTSRHGEPGTIITGPGQVPSRASSISSVDLEKNSLWRRSTASLGSITDFLPVNGDGPANIVTSDAVSITSSRRSSNSEMEQAAVLMGPPPRRTIDTKRVEELEAKLRLMENKRADDREKLKTIKKLQDERDRFESVIQKLQAKYQPQQQELVRLRRQLQQSSARVNELETTQGEHESSLEMATLDREMAEETAESLRTELESLKAKTEELEEEINLLKEENTELGHEISPEQRTSQSWLQMEKSNERLKEALVRLRDVTQTQEADLKMQVAGLQAELKRFGNMTEQYEAIQERLQHANAAIEELKAQLDAALGAEELVEELTEQNLVLTERVSNLTSTIEDLENLKELNEELEKGHVDAEKQLQDELDRRDAIFADHHRQAAKQDERLSEYEHSIIKLQAFVTTLQTELRHLYAASKVAESEVEDFDSQSRQVANLRLRLRDATIKAQTLIADAELARLEMQEMEEHLGILRHFLPEDYKSAEIAIRVYLCLRKITCTSALLRKLLTNQITVEIDERQAPHILQACNMLDQLAFVEESSGRIAEYLRYCKPERFVDFAVTTHEVESVDKTLGQYMEQWKTGNLQFRTSITELQSHVSSLNQLAKTWMEGNVDNSHADAVTQITVIRCRIEHFRLVIIALKALVNKGVEPIPSDNIESTSAFVQVLDEVASDMQIAMTTAESVLELLLLLKTQHVVMPSGMDKTLRHTSDLVDVAYGEVLPFGQDVLAVIEENDSDEVLSSLIARLTSIKRLSGIGELVQSILRNIQHLMTAAAAPNGRVSRSPPPPPWTLLAPSRASPSVASPAINNELTQLKSTLQLRVADVQARDRTIEEQNIKLELLESRMRDAAAKTQRIQDLDALLDETAQSEQDLRSQLMAQAQELQRLRSEQERFEAEAAERAAAEEEQEGGASAREVEALKAEILDLQGAVRLLKRSATTQRYSAAETAWLLEPLVPSAKKASAAAETLDKKKEKHVLQLFDEFLDIVGNARGISLKALPANERLAWRPMSEKTAWVVAGKREEWTRWVDKGRRFQ